MLTNAWGPGNPDRTARGPNRLKLTGKLFAQDALVEGVAFIEQHGEGPGAVLTDLDPGHIADFLGVGRGGDGAAVGLVDLDGDPGVVPQQRTPPAPWPEGGDGGQGEKI